MLFIWATGRVLLVATFGSIVASLTRSNICCSYGVTALSPEICLEPAIHLRPRFADGGGGVGLISGRWYRMDMGESRMETGEPAEQSDNAEDGVLLLVVDEESSLQCRDHLS